jgi:hypothetical protein
MGFRRSIEQLKEFCPGLCSFDAGHENLSLFQSVHDNVRFVKKIFARQLGKAVNKASPPNSHDPSIYPEPTSPKRIGRTLVM